MRRIPTLVRMIAVCLVAAAAGVLSAQALGEVGLPPITVSLPTVSLPIPTAPPPPLPAPPPAPKIPPAPPTPPIPIPVPAPPPAAVTPPVAITPPAAVAPPTAATAATPAGNPPAPLPTDSPSSSVSPSSSTRPLTPQAAGPARVTRFRATYRRVRTVGKRRTAARITFTLTAPARVRFLVRGPAPSCDVIARFAVRGRAGKNQVRFTGKIGKRRLAPGTYRIVARTGAGAASRPILVVVGRGPVERPSCSTRQSGAGAASVFDELAASFGAGAAQPPSTRGSSKSGGVLPAIGRKIRELPDALPTPPVGRVSDPAGLPTWIVGLLLPLAALGGFALIVYVVRYLRRMSVYY